MHVLANYCKDMQTHEKLRILTTTEFCKDCSEETTQQKTFHVCSTMQLNVSHSHVAYIL